MKYYTAKLNQDFRYIASLFNPRNNEFMNIKKTTADKVKRKINRTHYILALDDKKIGWFNLRVNEDIATFGIIIDKPFQGKGYGQKALEVIELEAKKRGIKKLKLEVSENNKKAIWVYKKAGYKQTGRLISMEKLINKDKYR